MKLETYVPPALPGVLPDDAPALIDMSVTQVQHGLTRVWCEIDAGACIRILHLWWPPRVVGWLRKQRPAGAGQVTRITARAMRASMAGLLADCARGEVFEVAREMSTVGPETIIGYLSTEAPPCYAHADLPVTIKRAGGRCDIAAQHEEPEPASEPWEEVRNSYRALSIGQRKAFRKWYAANIASRRGSLS